MTDEQKLALTRALPLRWAYVDALSPFETELLDECITRYRDRGAKAVMTDREWEVVQECLGAMEARRDDKLRAQADAEAAQSMRGAA